MNVIYRAFIFNDIIWLQHYHWKSSLLKLCQCPYVAWNKALLNQDSTEGILDLELQLVDSILSMRGAPESCAGPLNLGWKLVLKPIPDLSM